MLRIFHAGLAVNVTFDAGYDPPRPALTTQRRRTALPNIAASAADAPFLFDGGLTPFGRPVRLVSSERQGFVTHAQAVILRGLYEAGGSFGVETDLLVAIGVAAVTYDALWDPEEAPQFPAAANGQLYYVDLPLLLKEAP